MPWRDSLWLAPAAALAVRLAALLLAPATPEAFEYDRLARSVLSGRGYVLDYHGTEYRGYSSGLVYTAVTTAAYALGDVGPGLMWLVQAVVAATTAVVVQHLARVLGASRGQVQAVGLVVALHPALVYYDVRKLHPLGLDALLPAAFLAGVLTASRGGTAACLRCGFVLGLAALERLTMLPMLVVAAFWMAGARPLPRLAAFVGATLAVLAPWLARNQVVFGAPLLSTLTAEYFYMGNVPPSLGSYHLPSGDLTLEAAPRHFREALAGADEQGQARLFREASWAFVSEEPWRFAAGVIVKLARFWTWAPQTGVAYPAGYRTLYLAFYVPLLAATLAGGFRLWRSGGTAARQAAGLVVALMATVSVVQCTLYFEMRHRWALEPLMIALAVFVWPATSARPAGAAPARTPGTGRRSDAGAPR